MFSYKPLFKTLIDKEKKKNDLRNDLGLSPVIISRFSKNEYVSMETLDKICDYLDCEISDVIEHIKYKEKGC